LVKSPGHNNMIRAFFLLTPIIYGKQAMWEQGIDCHSFRIKKLR